MADSDVKPGKASEAPVDPRIQATQEWLQQLTGIAPDGKAGGQASALDRAAEFEQRNQARQAMLVRVRAQLNTVKAPIQQCLASATVKQGAEKGRKLLVIKGTSMQEFEKSLVDLEQDVDFDPKLKPGFDQGWDTIRRLSGEMKQALVEDPATGKDARLFEDAEIFAELWQPLYRERIIPETLVPDEYSEDARMIRETNAAYMDGVKRKKAQGKLTPEGSPVSYSLNSAATLTSLAADAAGSFVPGGELASTILQGTSDLLTQSARVYDQLAAKKFGDAASLGVTMMGSVTSLILSNVGVPKDTVDLVNKGFTLGSVAVLAGADFARGVDGVEDGLTKVASVFGKAFTAAASATASNPDPRISEALGIVGVLGPSLFKMAVLAKQGREKVLAQDYKGLADLFAEAAKEVLSDIQEIRSIEAGKGKSDDQKKDIAQSNQDQQDAIDALIDTTSTGVKASLALRKSEFNDALTEIINAVGTTLQGVMSLAGVPAEAAKLVTAAYGSAVTAKELYELLNQDKPDYKGVVTKLSTAIPATLKTLAGDDDKSVLVTIGDSLKTGLAAIADGINAGELIAAGKIDEALAALSKGLTARIKELDALVNPPSDSGDDSSDDAGDDTGGDDAEGGDEGGDDAEDADSGDKGAKEGGDDVTEARKALDDVKKQFDAHVKQLKQLAGTGEAGARIAEKLEKKKTEVDKLTQANDEQVASEEAQAILDEAELDLREMDEAEKAVADASSLEVMIAKVQRDQMIFNLATQITSGGAEALAHLVPALGAVSAGIKLVAQLAAAGKRAQQLTRWLSVAGDLERAQSGLSSSARNFVKNQREQLVHYAAQSLCAATVLAGRITELSPAAPVGKLVGAVGAFGAKAETFIYDQYKQADLEKSWKMMQKSFRAPTNRRLALEVREQSATLAKYSIAWGAVVLQDPLARNAMRACNLTEASLQSAGADVHKVVAYLEAFYPDDPQIYRELKDKPSWLPTDPDLTPSSWADLLLLLQDNQIVDKAGIGSTGTIDSLLAEFAGLRDDSSTADQLLAAQTKFGEAFTALKKAREERNAQRQKAEEAAKAKGQTLPPIDPEDPAERPKYPLAEVKEVLTALEQRRTFLQERGECLSSLAQAYAGWKPQPKPHTSEAAARKAAEDILAAVGKQFAELAKGLADASDRELTEVQLATVELQSSRDAFVKREEAADKKRAEKSKTTATE